MGEAACGVMMCDMPPQARAAAQRHIVEPLLANSHKI